MYLSSLLPFPAATLLALLPTALSTPASPYSISKSPFTARQTSLESWLATENATAWKVLFANIGNSGGNVPGVNAGVVVASPSTSSPDYFFQWTRDAAIVFKTIINAYINGNDGYNSIIQDYIAQNSKLQHTPNPSGSGGPADYYKASGEPKFHVDGSAFTGDWGRPQSDGPALRAVALMNYANAFLTRGGSAAAEYINTHLYGNEYPASTVIKADLEYISHHWNLTTFDPWEEVSDTRIFFNLAVQYRALIEGAAFANARGDTGAGSYYAEQASYIRQTLPAFIVRSQNSHIRPFLNSNADRFDIQTLLAILHGAGGSGTGLPLDPTSDIVLRTVFEIVRVFERGYFPINSNKTTVTGGVAIGRYNGDVYDGNGTSQGNPWFLSTATIAEIIYNALNLWDKAGVISVSEDSGVFFRMFLSSASSGATYPKGSAEYNTIATKVKTWADSFLAVVQTHAMGNGSLSEQFNRWDGHPAGARDLTWSYASFITAYLARQGTPAF